MKFLSVILICIILATSSLAQKAQAKWQISDYLKNLPKKFKTFYGDNIASEKNRKTLIDNKNGYAAYHNPPIKNEMEDLFFFEMAKFNPQKGYPTLVITNYKSDHVCADYETFFLQKRGSKWINVKSNVLPKLKESMFFKDLESYKYFKTLEKKFAEKTGGVTMHFYPPRKGTKMVVSLEMCDYVDDDITDKDAIDNYLTSSDAFKNVYLKWNKYKGKFVLIEEE